MFLYLAARWKETGVTLVKGIQVNVTTGQVILVIKGTMTASQATGQVKITLPTGTDQEVKTGIVQHADLTTSQIELSASNAN